jgi:hypothetical protein
MCCTRCPLASGERYRHQLLGRTLPWKLPTSAAWCALGRRTGRAVHIGRAGTVERVAWAEAIGATSIDPSLPLWPRDRLDAFIRSVT